MPETGKYYGLSHSNSSFGLRNVEADSYWGPLYRRETTPEGRTRIFNLACRAYAAIVLQANQLPQMLRNPTAASPR